MPASACRISGNPSGPWVTLAHPIGSSQDVWGPVRERLDRDYRVLTYDIRGHGQGEPAADPGGFDGLAGDCLALWDRLDIGRSHYVGLSLGGCIGVALAACAPARVSSLTVACSRLDMDEAASRMWRERADLVLAQGMAPIVEATLERWLSPPFRAAHPDVVAQTAATLRATSPAGFAHCARALAGGQPLDRLGNLTMPVQYLAGLRDQAVPAEHLRRYQQRTPGSRYLELDGPHLLHHECPQAFADALSGFFGAAQA